MIGQTISHYKILEKLGEGGMGVVYKAQDTKLHRPVALKFLPANLGASHEDVARFQQEAKAISALNHPNIATIYDFEEADGQKFLVLEYLPGGTLRSRIKSIQPSGRKLSPQELIEYGLQIAEGLAYAHRHGIIHRDVKTENMMLTEEGKVKITDFGLAKLRGSAHLTKTGSTVGTAAYMSPEQILGENVDHRSDLFSFGIVFYELATGQLPFRGEHEAALSYSIVNEAPVLVRSLRSDLLSSFENVIYRSLEKDREKRYKSAEEILNDLRELHHEVSAAMGVSISSARRKSTLPWLVIASVIVFALVAFYLLIPRTPISVDRQSIAVLAFRNMSEEKENEYFSDGMSEEIISALAKIEGLQVASRTSAFQFKAKEQDIRRIGEQLNVRTVLEGSVRKAGNKLRITAQLINVADGYHLWSETYERDMEDVFTIQEEISQRIANALKVKLVGEDAVPLVKHYTENLEAYNLFLKGRYHWNKRTEEGFRKAIEFFEQAIERDPKYALAYAGLADCYNLLSAYGLLPPRESVPKARDAATKALEIDNALAEGHEALAHVRMLYDWDWPEAEQGFKRAIELNPSYATAYQRYAIYLTAAGRLPEAILQIKRAQELDPLSLIINTDVGLILYLDRQYNQAIEQYRKTLELDPNFAVAHFALGLAYIEKGKFEEAIGELQRAITLSGGSTIMLATLGHAYTQAGKRVDAQKVLDDLKKASKQRYVSPYSIAAIYAGIGERDRAFEWLEMAYQDRSVWLIHLHLRVDPRLDSLRSDPRFVALLSKMGLEK